MNGFHPALGSLSLSEATPPAEAVGGDKDEPEQEDDMDYEEEVDDEFDRHAFGLYQQLPVPSGEPDLSSEPQTAEEYLQRVRYGSSHDLVVLAKRAICVFMLPWLCRYEAAQLPDTMISTLDSSQYDDQRTSYVDTSSTSSIDFQNLRPDWIRGFVNDFGQLRSDLAWWGHTTLPVVFTALPITFAAQSAQPYKPSGCA